MADTQSVSQAIIDYMVRLGIPFAAGVPGHGIIAFVDALSERREDIGTIMVRHEQSAVHLVDGYYRASGRPAACFTSVGPGAINTLVGMGTAFADSSAMVVFTANCPTYMFERGAIQGIDMHHWADFTRMALPVTKRSWQITNPRQAPEVVHRAFATATSGRPGPCHVELPMDIQTAALNIPMPDPSGFSGKARPAGDPDEVRRAARALLDANRPMILAGGGVISADATPELRELAEYLGIPVVTTIMGKGAIPEDHDLSVFYAGSKASTCGQAVAKSADIILAVGCRFAEWTCSSYASGKTYTIPPQKIIQIDIDSWEIGKNYPVEHPIAGDAKLVLGQLLGEIKDLVEPRNYQESAYFSEIQTTKEEWRRQKAVYADDRLPMTTSRLLAEMRIILPRDAIVVGAAGHAQATLFQEFPIYEPRTHLSTGAFSTMGWCIPAAIGAKLARPDKVVVAISGDGDFLMTCQELATAAQYGVPVIFCVLNNNGWISIRDLQLHNYGAERVYATEFLDGGRNELSIDYAGIANSFGIRSERIETPDQVATAIARARGTDGPYLLEVKTAMEYPRSEGAVAGWADFPVPEHIATSMKSKKETRKGIGTDE